MALAHRTWILRARRQLCVNYQDLCSVSMKDTEQREKGKNSLSDLNRKRLDNARFKLSQAIDELNAIVDLPPGS